MAELDELNTDTQKEIIILECKLGEYLFEYKERIERATTLLHTVNELGRANVDTLDKAEKIADKIKELRGNKNEQDRGILQKL